MHQIWHDTSVEHERFDNALYSPPEYEHRAITDDDFVLRRIGLFLAGMLTLMSPCMGIRAWYDGSGAIDTSIHTKNGQVKVLTGMAGSEIGNNAWEWMDVLALPNAVRCNWTKFVHKYLSLMPNLRGMSNALHAML